MDWLDRKPDTLNYHLAHPAIDSSKYIQMQRLRLGEFVASRHRIYLDTKQWLHMRDVAMGHPRNQTQAAIFTRLQTLSSSNKILCPISYSVFVELMRQSDEKTRMATARIIDQLGCGYCCLPPHSLTERELMYFMIDKGGGGNPRQPPIQHTVWTKVAFVFGEMMPVSTVFTREEMSAIQRSMDDLLRQITVEELIAQYGSYEWSEDARENEQLVKQLAEGKEKHANDHTTFHKLLCEEIYGGLDALRDILENVMIQFARLSGFTTDISPSDRKLAGQSLANLVANAFRLRKLSNELPQIHIHAALHAAVRWDRARKYDANDFEDFRHACVALPYYDCFCTERGLCHLICQKSLRLDDVYKTKVLSSDTEFLDYVNSLSAV